jgi:hypothetical protein
MCCAQVILLHDLIDQARPGEEVSIVGGWLQPSSTGFFPLPACWHLLFPWQPTLACVHVVKGKPQESCASHVCTRAGDVHGPQAPGEVVALSDAHIA